MTPSSVTIDGYDLLAEQERLSFPDITVQGHTINRGSAVVDFQDGIVPGELEARRLHDESIITTTLDPVGSPSIDLSYPTAGMFVGSARGVYLDLYHGVGQRLLDTHHPCFGARLASLQSHGLTFRREINTDDYEYFSIRSPGLAAPQDLAALVDRLVSSAFPSNGQYKCFFSNSGAEAGEAAVKLAMLYCYRRVLAKYGEQAIVRLMSELGIERDAFFDGDGRSSEPVYKDYPFFIVGCDGAFHGRTLGVLGLTRSKGVQQIGFGKLRWIRHICFNGDPAEFRNLLDLRPLGTLLEHPGAVREIIQAGRMPVDLVAAFFTEVYQGEGGYRIADRAWIQAVSAECRRHGILTGIDEVQSFGRTGRLFAAEHYGIDPDIIWMAKGAVLGITAARKAICEGFSPGWHSNTFGSGKLFDVNMAYATIEALVAFKDPHFEHRTYLDNSRIKGEYLRVRLAELLARYDDVLVDFSGLGGMWGLSVRHRDLVLEWGRKLGAKMLGCGVPGDVARIRIILLADVLTREIDQIVSVLDRVFCKVSSLCVDD